MPRTLPIRVHWGLCLLVPGLVFVAVYYLVRELHPYSEPEAASWSTFTEEEQVGQITDAFRLYAEAFDHRFPDVDRFHGDALMRTVRHKLQIPALAGHSPKSGFGHLTALQRDDPAFCYRGAGARLGDPRRVLVCWSAGANRQGGNRQGGNGRGANRRHVVFCDLSHQEVDVAELDALFTPWQASADRCVVRVGAGGSGTVVSPRGFIVTADHVLPTNDTDVEIRFADGRIRTSAVVTRSKRFDVAVLRILVDEPIPFIPISGQRVNDGEPAWVAGYGGGRSEPLLREVRSMQYVLDELITTWNQVIGGDSGGAVLDARGRLIGVVLGPADPVPKSCRAISSVTLQQIFPVLAMPDANRVQRD